jgi:uncharacterized membrane protein
MSAMYITIGVKHFSDPIYFVNITPPFVPFKEGAVYITGIIEILAGVLILFKRSRAQGAYLLIFLLIIVFPANIYLYISELPRDLLGITKNQALMRLPFQIPLLILAYWHSQSNSPAWLTRLSFIVFLPTIIYFISL